MHHPSTLVFSLLIGLLPVRLSAQPDSVAPRIGEDTTLVERAWDYGPRAALAWSIIPGGGQVYNGDWWKVPVVYGSLLGSAGYAYFRDEQYRRIWRALRNRCLGGQIAGGQCSPPPDSDLANVPTSALITARNNANKARQVSLFVMVFVYLAQGMEAFTDAHLEEFDTSDDLSLRVNTDPSQDRLITLAWHFTK